MPGFLLPSFALVLALLSWSVGAASFTFAWDAAAAAPAGTTYQLQTKVNGGAWSSSTTAALTLTKTITIAGGDSLYVQLRAVAPTGYTCGTPPVACPYSVWVTFPQLADANTPVIYPHSPVGLTVNLSQVTLPPTPPPTPPPVSGGLMLALGFDEASGTQAIDSSGSGNAGTLVGAPTRSSGKFGSALTFGSGKYVTVPNSTSVDIGGKGLTLSFYAKIAGTGGDQVLIDKPWNATAYPSPYYQYGVEFSAGFQQIILYLGDSAGSGHTYPLTAPLGVWTAIAYTYDGANVKGYIDGVLKFTTPATFSIQAKGNPLRIGLDHTGGQPTNGALDEIRIYNRALSVSEIQADIKTAVVH